MRLHGRGRVAKWTRERISTLTTPELRQLRVNAERLLETEVVAVCTELLDERPRGRTGPRRPKRQGSAGT
jgi:hypothetical protein